MVVGSGAHTYTWVDNWARLPETPSSRQNGRTHGVAVTRDSRVVVFCQADPAVLIFDPNGKLISSWGDRFSGPHGLTLVQEGDTEYLWLTDEYSGQVVKTTLDGQTVQQIEKPNTAAYETARYSPTWVAVNEERFGGNGDIWVADGYGASLVHCYDKAGQYRLTLSGEEGAAGRFDCPHGIWTDTRHGEPELLIADRGNHRVQVYGFDGSYRRTFGAESLTSPCGFAVSGGDLVIPELCAALAIFDSNDAPAARLAEHPEAPGLPGWPEVGQDAIVPGKLNSPHGVAAGPDGSLYVVEWLVGGRITKLAR